MNRENFLQPLTNYLGVANQESDRGKVLVALAQIDVMLEEVLRSFFLDGEAASNLFNGPNAPLGTLYNKSNTACALALITPEECTAINLLRKVRNEFAHSVHVEIDNPKIKAILGKMTFGLDRLIEIGDPVLDDPRARFSMSSVSLISSLYNRAHYVAKEKRHEREWHQ